MGMLIKNEFYKLKREWFMVFLLLLSLLPIITGGAGAIFNSSTKSLADLFFFMNNQFSMFFPMVLFILIGSLFYQEYKNKTYINWITYGFSKKKLFLSKVTVSVVIGICFAAVLFIAFGLLVAILNGAGRLTGGISLFLKLAIGFGIEAGVVVFVTTCLGAIVINLSRNIIVTSVVGVIYGFVSCLFIGSERGFVIPGSLIGCVLALVINVIAGFPGVHFGNLLNMFIRVTGANIGIYISVLPIILLFCCSANNFLGGVALAFVYGYFGTFEGTLLNYYPIKASMILVDPTCGAEYGYTYHIFPAFIIMVLTFLISVIILANKKKDARILTVAKKKKIVRKKGW